jgi:hypothetical protein
MSRVDQRRDSALLREVRRWLALAVEDLGFGVAVAEAGSERILFANRYAQEVWRRLAQGGGAAGSYRGFAPDALMCDRSCATLDFIQPSWRRSRPTARRLAR